MSAKTRQLTRSHRIPGYIYCGLVATLIVGCHDDPFVPAASEQTPQGLVSGRVSGLGNGNQVVLANNGGDRQTVVSDGVFAFPSVLQGSSFTITALSSGLSQDCVVTGGSGIASAATTASIRVTCAASQRNAFHPAADMTVGRVSHHLLALVDGTALAVGGDSPPSTGSSPTPVTMEQYDPQTDQWTQRGAVPGSGNLIDAFVLPSGNVLLTRSFFLFGTIGSPHFYISETSIYNPSTQTTRPAQLPATASGFSNAFQLDDGRVVAYADGGLGAAEGSIPIAFDPITEVWGLVSASALIGAGFIRLGDGRYVNWSATSGTTLYNPTTGQVSPGPVVTDYDPNIPFPPSAATYASLTRLPNGFVLLVGRQAVYNPGCILGVSLLTDVFDYGANAWLRVAAPLPTLRDDYTATATGSGALFLGGLPVQGVSFDPLCQTAQPPLDVAEAFDAQSNTWTRWQPMSTPRVLHAAVLLGGGKVLVSGGLANQIVPPYNYLKRSELGY